MCEAGDLLHLRNQEQMTGGRILGAGCLGNGFSSRRPELTVFAVSRQIHILSYAQQHPPKCLNTRVPTYEREHGETQKGPCDGVKPDGP